MEELGDEVALASGLCEQAGFSVWNPNGTQTWHQPPPPHILIEFTSIGKHYPR